LRLPDRLSRPTHWSGFFFLFAVALAGLLFFLPIGLCGFGGVFSIRRNTSSRDFVMPPSIDEALKLAFARVFGIGSLSGAPKYAMALSDIVTWSAAIDYRLVVVFASVTETPLAIVERALNEMANSHARIKALRAMNADFAPDDKFRQSLADLLEEADALAKSRAKYVHGYWIVGDGQVKLVNRQLPFNSRKRERPVPLTELTDLGKQLQALHSKIQDLIHPLLPPPTLPESIARRLPKGPRRRDRKGRKG
jgi:hypothetical protein